MPPLFDSDSSIRIEMKPNTAGFFTTLSILIFVFGSESLSAQPGPKIQVSDQNQPWSLTVGSADIVGGAGGDFASEYESAVDEKQLKIINRGPPNLSRSYRVDVRKDDSSWDSRITLYIRRTSDGTGTGTITGGTVYQEVTGQDMSFFSGNENRDNIDVQFKVSGGYAGEALSADSYVTGVVYTVTRQ